MAKPLPLPVFDRDAGKIVEELLDDHPTTYESEPQKAPTQWLESQPLYDWCVAMLQHAPWSRRKIEPFIRKHNIDMSAFEPGPFRSYAHFFVRKFRPGMRHFPETPGEMGAFAEARYMGWDVLDLAQRFPIKGHSLDAARILGNAERARRFEGGPVLLARLAPIDYHRLHFPDDGVGLERESFGGRLWTVNWHALQNKDDILFVNERAVSYLKTQNFGVLAFVEVGAMTVGRIVQSHQPRAPFKRGEEKSCFSFGGSAVVVFGEPDTWRPEDDVLRYTRMGIETYLRLGEVVARK
jgi:phosphatidylserine decarboxylase